MTTEAGKRLLNSIVLDGGQLFGGTRESIAASIAAIEVEAAAAVEAKAGVTVKALATNNVSLWAVLEALMKASANLSDRRTLDSDGFWVSQKEMKALDAALVRAKATDGTNMVAEQLSAAIVGHMHWWCECEQSLAASGDCPVHAAVARMLPERR